MPTEESAIRRLVISGSMRHHEAMQEWARALERGGLEVEAPVLILAPEEMKALGVDEQRERKRIFMEDHDVRIDRSDAMLAFNVGGHLGASATMEMGRALGRGIPVYAVANDEDLGRDVAYAGHCSSPEELLVALAELDA
jgi:nucleoside 2-deoxyribosyltransferase